MSVNLVKLEAEVEVDGEVGEADLEVVEVEVEVLEEEDQGFILNFVNRLRSKPKARTPNDMSNSTL